MLKRKVVFAAALLQVLIVRPDMAEPPATVDQVIAAGHDLWAEQALAQPGGPSYEFFEKLLPPLRYVDADFLYYPIVLSAPQAKTKARLISNGSAINALARQPNWRGEAGTPVHFRVGDRRQFFGGDLRKLTGPTYLNGYLPIVQLQYRDGETTYQQEAFAPVDEAWSRYGAAVSRFALVAGKSGKVEAAIESAAPLSAKNGIVTAADGKVIAQFNGDWEFNVARNTLYGQLAPDKPLLLAVFTEPAETALSFVTDSFDTLQKTAVATWQALLERGTQIDVPEPIVNRAYKSLLIGSFATAAEHRLNYSAGNQYAKTYVAEGGDALRSLSLYGYTADTRPMLEPIFDLNRKGLEFHQSAFKLQTLAQLYWLTRDTALLKEQQPLWQKYIDILLAGRDPATGLLPREKYCGDLDTVVISLHSNAAAWRALRDWSAVLADNGEQTESARLRAAATEFRTKILSAVDQIRAQHKTDGFVPIALSGEESGYDRIVESRLGNYWNIMSSYVLGSGVFRYDSATSDALIGYVQTHAGRIAGLNRSRPNPSFWVSTDGINDLYGLRYTLTLLQRDDVDHALVGFYGKLALGLTRDTFIGSEGSCIRPQDEFGRQFYLPPNTASNANFLTPLRYLLVQDWDLDDDGTPDTLRLAFATPRAWLEDRKTIRLENARTAFGPVSYTIDSALVAKRVTARLTLPDRKSSKTLLRLRLPEGFSLSGARSQDKPLAINGDVIDLTGFTGDVDVVADVEFR
jgi:hypothetical protein